MKQLIKRFFAWLFTGKKEDTLPQPIAPITPQEDAHKERSDKRKLEIAEAAKQKFTESLHFLTSDVSYNWAPDLNNPTKEDRYWHCQQYEFQD